jgi:hypothetical protein
LCAVSLPAFAGETPPRATPGTLASFGFVGFANIRNLDRVVDVAAGGAADVDGDGRLDACECAEGDGNLDGIIGPEDLTMLLSAWGTTGVPFGDLDLNGTVAASDLAVILASWGSRP